MNDAVIENNIKTLGDKIRDLEKRIYELEPFIKKVNYRCGDCNHAWTVKMKERDFKPPSCPHCNNYNNHHILEDSVKPIYQGEE